MDKEDLSRLRRLEKDNMNDAEVKPLLEHISGLNKKNTALRAILSRVREWVDNAALVESEEREIRGILEEGGEG